MSKENIDNLLIDAIRSVEKLRKGGATDEELSTSSKPRTISIAENIQAFPTEQAIRQKEQKKKKKLQLENDGLSKEEIKQLTKRKAVDQEKHYDDYGSDTCPIEFTTSRTLLVQSDNTCRDTIDYCFYD